MAVSMHTGLALALLMGSTTSASADSPPPDPTFHLTYEASDWRELVPEKAAAYKNYRVIILGNPNYTDDEKAAKIARKYGEIRDEVRKSRLDAYSAISELVGVGNSATKGSSGGDPKKVDAKCAGASKEHMYTTPAWARGAYKSGDDAADANVISSGNPVNANEIVLANGSQVCAVKLKQSGKGRKVSYSEATFHIRPEQIKKIVEAELLSLMYAITNTPV